MTFPPQIPEDFLEPCPQCQRHVRTQEPLCPFCGSAPEWKARPRIAATRQLSRAALIALSAALGSDVVVACSSSSGSVYGLPPSDGGSFFDAGSADVGPDHLITLPDADSDAASADATVDSPNADADAEPSDATVDSPNADASTNTDAAPSDASTGD